MESMHPIPSDLNDSGTAAMLVWYNHLKVPLDIYLKLHEVKLRLA